MSEIKLGKYKHYKGGIVEVIGVASHSETLEEFVVYRCLYKCKTNGEGSLWVRPLKMFLEKVNVNNKNIPRFEYIEK